MQPRPPPPTPRPTLFARKSSVQKTLIDSDIAVPPEWAPQKAIWTAWPADPAAWYGDLAKPRADVAAMVLALARTNVVRVLVNGAEAEASALAAFGEAAEIVPARYGDIWLRDIGPIFAKGREGTIALRFKTNAWGGKFHLPDDATVGRDIAKFAGVAVREFGFVLEGGAIDHDGEGTVLTTRQTLLNPNRNGWSEARSASGAARRARREKDRLDRRRPEERPHRRTHRQCRALRRPRPRRLPVACRRRRPKSRDAGGGGAEARRRDRRGRPAA